MSNEIEIYDKIDRLPIMQEAQDFFKWSQELAKCPFYAKLGAGGVIAILLTARELGLPPMASLNGGMYHIDGKVSLSAQMMNTLVLKAGHTVDIIKLDEEGCDLKFQRKDRKEPTFYSYTAKDAQKAGYLSKNNWKAHLKDMLFCRALSGGARKICPDAIGNCYVHGELNDGDIPVNHKFIATPPPPEEKNSEEPAKIEFVKAEGFDEFVKKHGIKDKKTKKYAYVHAISSTSNKTEDEIVNFAIANEERFEAGFAKWLESKPKTKVAKEAPKENPS